MAVGTAMLGAGALLGAGANFLGAKGQQQGIDAARGQVEYERGLQNDMTGEAKQLQAGLQAPWMQGGQQAFSDLQNFRMREADPYQAQSFQGVNMGEDPGVQYRMQQAQQGMDASAANRGSLFSGAQQKAMAEHMQNLASQEFGNAYQRQYGQFSDAENARREQSNLEAQRMMGYDQARMGQLQGLSGMGQNATSQLAGQYGTMDQGNMTRQQQLGGALTDLRGASAAAPWMTAAAGFGGAGKALTGMSGADFSSLFGTGA